MSTCFGDSSREEDLVFITFPLNSTPMTTNLEASGDNLIMAAMEYLSGEERQRYLVAEAHLKSEFRDTRSHTFKIS